LAANVVHKDLIVLPEMTKTCVSNSIREHLYNSLVTVGFMQQSLLSLKLTVIFQERLFVPNVNTVTFGPSYFYLAFQTLPLSFCLNT
jgi:hypothetical protein